MLSAREQLTLIRIFEELRGWPVRRIPHGAGIGAKTCLVRFDNNKYSVAASAVGRRSRFTPTPTAS
jgi:hypothetical protein